MLRTTNFQTIIKSLVMGGLFFLPVLVKAQETYIPLAPLPFGASNSTDFGVFLNGWISFGIFVAAVLAVIMIAIGGIQYMVTASSTEKSSGKKQVTRAIGGLILALAGWIILNTINPQLVNLKGVESISFVGVDDTVLSTSIWGQYVARNITSGGTTITQPPALNEVFLTEAECQSAEVPFNSTASCVFITCEDCIPLTDSSVPWASNTDSCWDTVDSTCRAFNPLVSKLRLINSVLISEYDDKWNVIESSPPEILPIPSSPKRCVLDGSCVVVELEEYFSWTDQTNFIVAYVTAAEDLGLNVEYYVSQDDKADVQDEMDQIGIDSNIKLRVSDALKIAPFDEPTVLNSFNNDYIILTNSSSATASGDVACFSSDAGKEYCVLNSTTDGNATLSRCEGVKTNVISYAGGLQNITAGGLQDCRIVSDTDALSGLVWVDSCVNCTNLRDSLQSNQTKPENNMFVVGNTSSGFYKNLVDLFGNLDSPQYVNQRDNNAPIAMRVTEAWVATVEHQSFCHRDGTCIDLNFINPDLSWMKGVNASFQAAMINEVMEAGVAAGVCPVYEVWGVNERDALINANANDELISGTVISLVTGNPTPPSSWANHFSVYHPQEDPDKCTPFGTVGDGSGSGGGGDLADPYNFNVGDVVETLVDNLGVRVGPTVSSNLIVRQSLGERGTITGGPSDRDESGLIWWLIDYEDGNSGYSIQGTDDGSEAYLGLVSTGGGGGTQPPEVAKFIIGDTVQVFVDTHLNVRDSANGALVGAQLAGAQGSVVDGPSDANGLTWWNVNFEGDGTPIDTNNDGTPDTTAEDGWVAEGFIEKVTP